MTTALGPIRVARQYTWHPDDGEAFRADAALGIDGFRTRQAARLVTLAGVDHSFARARQVLAEMCGWAVDDEVIRRATHAAAAPGDVEVRIDAGKVNTLDGWRDIKVGLLLKRSPGDPATPADGAARDLPAPAARAVVAAVEEVGRSGQRVRAEADRLGVTAAPGVTVLGDGAEGLRNLADEHLPQAGGVLDVYHALGHICGAVKAVWGDGDAAAGRAAAGRAALLAGGKAGFERWLAGQFPDAPGGASTDPLLDLAGYLGKHPTRLGYADRLAAGRSIGSRAVEGGIKQLVNLRLKRTGARWRAEHVGPLVELRALSQTPEWNDVWAAA